MMTVLTESSDLPMGPQWEVLPQAGWNYASTMLGGLSVITCLEWRRQRLLVLNWEDIIERVSILLHTKSVCGVEILSVDAVDPIP